jgi:transposase-like protein
MGKQRKVWTVEIKEQAVLRLLAGESAGKLVKEYGFAESQLYKWRTAFLEAGRQGLSNRVQSADAILEAENDQLKRLVAEKELMLSLAKKARGL